MIDLREEIQRNYKFLTYKVPELKVGFYEIKNYYLTESSHFIKLLYLETDVGTYQTKSRVLIGHFYGLIGRIINDVISRNETIRVEVISKKTNGGYSSLNFNLV